MIDSDKWPSRQCLLVEIRISLQEAPLRTQRKEVWFVRENRCMLYRPMYSAYVSVAAGLKAVWRPGGGQIESKTDL